RGSPSIPTPGWPTELAHAARIPATPLCPQALFPARSNTPLAKYVKRHFRSHRPVLMCEQRGADQGHMSLKTRSILVLVVGTVLGLTVSLGSSVLAERAATRTTRTVASLSPESGELLTQVVERVRAEYVDTIDDERLV